MMNKAGLIFILLVVFSLSATAQNLSAMETELATLLDKLRTAQNDSEKQEANVKFKSKLEEVIQLPGAFDHPFSSLKTVGTVKSPDNVFRLFNWNVEQDDLTQKYYCYILRFDEKSKKYKLIELKDNSLMLPQRPTEILEADNWYGALYYKIIPSKKGSKTIYTVLGWDGNNSVSTMKVIDVLNFSGNTVRLGSPIFKMNKETLKRVFFEYSKKTTMYLSYEEQYDRIIYDHLAPETPALVGMYSMYVPDLSYDALVNDNGKWVLKEDVIGVNKDEPETITILVKDEKTGELKEKKIKNKWEEPSKSHVATTPEDQMREEQKEKLKQPTTTSTF
ncbi:MAG TPA: hypothetical protein VKZ44_04475, partial [Taishania sp.]|nr:hypothetical protein [Taishania sp.]